MKRLLVIIILIAFCTGFIVPQKTFAATSSDIPDFNQVLIVGGAVIVVAAVLIYWLTKGINKSAEKSIKNAD